MNTPPPRIIDLSKIHLAVLGSGNMGEAVLAGALRAGVLPENVVASDTSAKRLEEVARKHGVHITSSNETAVRNADVVLVAVKPKDVEHLLGEVAGSLKRTTVVVSVAAGITTGHIEEELQVREPVVKVMPNTPAAIGAGVSALSAGYNATDDDVALVKALFAGTGVVVEVPESLQAAAGALAGSGPAYVFYVIDALAEAGVAIGLTRAMALDMAVKTVLGSARLLDETGEHPAMARERVSSPGGTTIEALRVLDDSGVRAAIVNAVVAARDRTDQITEELEDQPVAFKS